MPVEVVAYMLSDQNINRRLQFQLILQCAPLLKGSRLPASQIWNVGTVGCLAGY